MQESTGKATAIDSLCIVSLRNRECLEPLFFSEYIHYETTLFYEFALSFSSDTNCYFGWLIDLIDLSLSRPKGPYIYTLPYAYACALRLHETASLRS
jgi:hypothetical protein